MLTKLNHNKLNLLIIIILTVTDSYGDKYVPLKIKASGKFNSYLKKYDYKFKYKLKVLYLK